MHQQKLYGRNLFRVQPTVLELKQSSSFGTLRKFSRIFLRIRGHSLQGKCKNLKGLSRYFSNLSEHVLVVYANCAIILMSLQLIYKNIANIIITYLAIINLSLELIDWPDS